MTEEKTATRALTGNRQMHKSFQSVQALFNPTTFRYEPEEDSLTWQNVGSNGLYQETYFDTSGYTRDMLTIYPLTAYVQEAGRYSVSSPGSIRLICVDLITTERIPDMNQFVFDIVDNDLVSFPNSNVDFTQVIFGRFREFTGITQGTSVQDVFAPVNDQQFGSLEPTTSDKLWIYKILVTIGVPAGESSQLLYPSSRIVLQADIQKESELPFMMRQKRSYELSNY